jgi:hypothetical protein
MMSSLPGTQGSVHTSFPNNLVSALAPPGCDGTVIPISTPTTAKTPTAAMTVQRFFEGDDADNFAMIL